ncbi:MAG: methyltransferase family protein [Bacteroidetes bacterium]|jgi:2-polyprenyl-3-methyl-5-hydroxy-6-metoxy-1,4-benzoquinol methylase|nr:methyltransferase family protein [Bacteroidota bacterium]MDF2453849.1 methyltransferase family protein [Bacteroidota bacterium]
MSDDPYKITFTTWNKIAGIYQDKFMDLDLYNDTYDLFCERIVKRNPRILEIGCGPGNITRYLLSKRPDMNIEAIDIAPNMIELATKNNPAARFNVMDCREIDQLYGKFDAVICGFCMPYLSQKDCEKLIRDSAGLLNPEGILYLSTIEGNYEDSGYEAGSSGDRSYVYYHNEEHLTRQLTENKFEVIDVIRKKYAKTPEIISTHLIFIACKK